MNEQDSVMTRHGGQAAHVLLLACFTARNVMHAYFARLLLVSILQDFSTDAYVSVQFKLSCAVAVIDPYSLFKFIIFKLFLYFYFLWFSYIYS